MRKAVREAKERTSWITPNVVFEEALEKFIDALMSDAQFLSDLENFLAPLIEPARINSLSVVLLKLTAPGIPDTYQGTELWDLSLVDPDNRRPVDFEVRFRRLCDVQKMPPEQILQHSGDGLPKLWTIRQSLLTRNSHTDSFGTDGAYQPLWATGPKAAHVVAFQRGENVIAAVPRLLMSLGNWETTILEIPEGSWRNQFTQDIVGGGKVELGTLLSRFPVALLTKE